MVISSQLNKSQKRLFVKGKHKSIRFVLALLLSFFLIVADDRYHELHGLRSTLSMMVSPLQYAVNYPISIMNWVSALVSAKKGLIQENMQLKYHQIVLESELQKLLVLQKENLELKQLLSSTDGQNKEALVAQILAVDTGNTRQVLVLNKGTREGVFVGQPVLDAKGVMGQVIDVGLMTSSVLLISDAKSAVPVRNNRTGERAILVGTNSMNELSLINLPKSSLIAKGDMLVTSGLGRRYPEGYPVGEVSKINHVPGDEFIKVTVTPMALLNRSQLVLLIWPEQEHQVLTSQINERLTILDEFLS